MSRKVKNNNMEEFKMEERILTKSKSQHESSVDNSKLRYENLDAPIMHNKSLRY